jgi:phenylalanyl-tRNA synthetase beta chain
MTISYNWLCEYLPVSMEPEKLSRVLTSIGLEVESLERYESIKGGLEGLVIGEVLSCEKHPDADKLSLTRVHIGNGDPLQIVCGAPNVAKGQKVVVAMIGTTIYPVQGEPLTMKKAKIRGVESQGMICAEDEIGIGESHAGILILPPDTKAGTPAADYFKPYTDWIYEIGITPNRIDAMSHLGVARDVCAWLSHHDKKDSMVKLPYRNAFKTDHQGLQFKIVIENETNCQRYAGVSISGVTVKESPEWLRNKLSSIGLRAINNIVDITNFILHETGQPLHAFDADQVKGQTIRVKNLPADTPFISLDDKMRLLHPEDLMICDGEDNPLCIGGVFGGKNSGVSTETTHIFLESAWFHPVSIRRSSMRHSLRTDAAVRFEKGVDISNTVTVLKRAALLIQEIAGGEIASELTDVYPHPVPKAEIALKYHYLKKLSGKNYHPDTVKKILQALGFELIKEGIDELWVTVPYSKPDVRIPADLVEEIMRIDGLDNVDIPSVISISPAVETIGHTMACREKLANMLVGSGLYEIFTNSITNSAFFEASVLAQSVKMLNSLSAELDILRPSMLETGLQALAYNLNRKNNDLRFFEFGKTYHTTGTGAYQEHEHFCIYLTGSVKTAGWQQKAEAADYFYLKGLLEQAASALGITITGYRPAIQPVFAGAIEAMAGNAVIAVIGGVPVALLDQFGIRQPVWYADADWAKWVVLHEKQQLEYQPLSKFPSVQRDLAIIVNRALRYEAVEKATASAKLNRLTNMSLFDVFESDKLGVGKKSLAMSFTFTDEEKTLTDKEIDNMMNRLIGIYEKELSAEVRGK